MQVQWCPIMNALLLELRQLLHVPRQWRRQDRNGRTAGKPPTDRFHHFRIVDVRIFRGACLRAAAESKRVGPSSSNPLCASCVDHGYVVELYEMQ